MFFDTHIHTAVSTDSDMDPSHALAVAAAMDAGLIFTEHVDMDYIGNDTDFRPDCGKYLADYAALRSRRLLLGVEIGMTHMSAGYNRELAGRHDFDYVIGSVHMVGTRDIFIDYFHQDKSRRQFYGEYLDYMLRMVLENDFFDSLAHIDYISRYSPFDDKDLDYAEYAEKYDAILTALLDKGKILELNTRRLGLEEARENLRRIYRRYRELGGKYVTVGSDAHTSSAIGYLFREADTFLWELDLKSVYFRGRKMVRQS